MVPTAIKPRTPATHRAFFFCFWFGSFLGLLGPHSALGQATINFLSVTSAGGTAVTIEYSVSFPGTHTQFPTVSWLDKEPYWILLHSQGGDPADWDPQDPTPPVEEDQREIIPASKRVAGTHEIEIDALNFSESLGPVGGSSGGAATPSDCSSCGSGGGSGAGLGSASPGLPFRLQFTPQLSGYQSSFGPGAMMLSKLADTNANGGAGISIKLNNHSSGRSKKFLAPLLPSWTGLTT